MDAPCDQALALIDDTAVNPGRWRRALDTSAAAVQAKAIALAIRAKAQRPHLTMMSSAYPDFWRAPAGRFDNAWRARSQARDWAVPRTQPAHRRTPDVAAGVPPQQLDARKDGAFLRKQRGAAGPGGLGRA